MSPIMTMIPLIRQGVLGVTTLFSLIVLAVSIRLISQTQVDFGITFNFCALGVAVSLMSLVTLPVMLIIDIKRRGVFTSMIVVEVAWLWITITNVVAAFLWILWVSTAGETGFPFGCNILNSIYNGICQEAQAIEAFSFLNFIILLLYTSFLSITSGISATRGRNVWLSSVKETFDSLALNQVEHPGPMNHYNVSGPKMPTGTPMQSQHHIAGSMHTESIPGAAAVV